MSAHAASGPSPEKLHRAALDYAARGVPVLPLRGKLPRIPAAHGSSDPLYGQCKGDCGRQGHGVHDASTDLEQVCDWWDRWPHATIGLRTGVAFDVIDVDGPKAATAWNGSWSTTAAWCRSAGRGSGPARAAGTCTCAPAGCPTGSACWTASTIGPPTAM
jgi:hypothetical protein